MCIARWLPLAIRPREPQKFSAENFLILARGLTVGRTTRCGGSLKHIARNEPYRFFVLDEDTEYKIGFLLAYAIRYTRYFFTMSGHNKWAQIKRQKGANDAARSAVFGKLARRITLESKKANGDQSAAALRGAIEKAKQANMPKENIERAIAKGTAADASQMDAVLYEAYGPGGAAILISAVTDNRNRTSAEIKHLLSKHGIALASPGSASWAFEKITEGFGAKSDASLSEADNTALMTILEELDNHDDVEDVYTNAA